MKHLNEGLITLNSVFVMDAIVAYPSGRFFTNVEFDRKQINLLNSQPFLQICTDHILRLTSASTEMHEQCLFGNALCLVRIGVSNYILNFSSALLYCPLHFTSAFNSTVLLAPYYFYF